jgi:hypothetical protein
MCRKYTAPLLPQCRRPGWLHRYVAYQGRKRAMLVPWNPHIGDHGSAHAWHRPFCSRRWRYPGRVTEGGGLARSMAFSRTVCPRDCSLRAPSRRVARSCRPLGGAELRMSVWRWGSQRPRLAHLCDARVVRVSKSGEGATAESAAQILCIPDSRNARLSGARRSSYTSRFASRAYCSINPPLDRISRSARRR